MKQPMTADEWYYKYGHSLSDFEQMQQYSTYLLQHHLKKFAEECKSNVRIDYKVLSGAMIDKQSIDQTLTDYLTKNNIR